jgi:hypothetical protein
MEDAAANFALTGKASFADFTKSVLADMHAVADDHSMRRAPDRRTAEVRVVRKAEAFEYCA